MSKIYLASLLAAAGMLLLGAPVQAQKKSCPDRCAKVQQRCNDRAARVNTRCQARADRWKALSQ